MPIKLLDILKKQVSEQGLYRKNTFLPTGQKTGDVIGAVEFGDKGEFIKYIDPSEIGKGSANQINVSKLDPANITLASSRRGNKYGWRGPIGRLCAQGKPRYCNWHWHAGRDYAAPFGTPTATLKSGKMGKIGPLCFYIEHDDGSKTKHCHYSKLFFNEGDIIPSGAIFQEVGNTQPSTGPHEHFEYYPPNATSRIEEKNGVTKEVKDTDPAEIDDEYIVFINPGMEDNFRKNIEDIGSGGGYNGSGGGSSNVKIFDRLPAPVQNAIRKLKTDWNVEITELHLDREMKQEGQTREDSGGVNSDALSAIKQFIKDCKKANPSVSYPTDIVSEYRSYDDQVRNFGSKAQARGIDDTQKWNSIPGFSQHHTGKGFDIFSTDPAWWSTNPKVKNWVANNCESYGFEITYKTQGILRGAEPWHLFYNGGEEYVEDDENVFETKTVVFGGTDYATPEWMKSQWVAAGLSADKAIFLPYTSTELSKIKKENKVDKIVGFSAGGSDVWDEIISNSSQYKFMGLIDPSTSESQFNAYKNGGLPSNVKSLSNHGNWGGYPDIKERLKQLEEKNILEKTNLSHEKIPLQFFKNYKSNLS
jgi:LAS superfamily LD-carboxypeptidase LdcB/murein DD-endopeptidase MepM/ murein hydrolase activator NlpD